MNPIFQLTLWDGRPFSCSAGCITAFEPMHPSDREHWQDAKTMLFIEEVGSRAVHESYEQIAEAFRSYTFAETPQSNGDTPQRIPNPYRGST